MYRSIKHSVTTSKAMREIADITNDVTVVVQRSTEGIWEALQKMWNALFPTVQHRGPWRRLWDAILDIAQSAGRTLVSFLARRWQECSVGATALLVLMYARHSIANMNAVRRLRVVAEGLAEVNNEPAPLQTYGPNGEVLDQPNLIMTPAELDQYRELHTESKPRLLCLQGEAVGDAEDFVQDDWQFLWEAYSVQQCRDLGFGQVVRGYIVEGDDDFTLHVACARPPNTRYVLRMRVAGNRLWHEDISEFANRTSRVANVRLVRGTRGLEPHVVPRRMKKYQTAVQVAAKTRSQMALIDVDHVDAATKLTACRIASRIMLDDLRMHPHQVRDNLPWVLLFVFMKTDSDLRVEALSGRALMDVTKFSREYQTMNFKERLASWLPGRGGPSYR